MRMESSDEMRFRLGLPRQMPRDEKGLEKFMQTLRGPWIPRALVRSYSRLNARGAGFGLRAPSPQMQRVAVRVTYSKNKGDGQWQAHGKYVARESAQHGQGKGEGFDSSHDNLNIAATFDSWEKNKDEHMFKIIVSPEFGERYDLKKHCRDLIARMEGDLGTKLEWCGVAHFNTDNPHVHLSIRGVREDGKSLVIDKDYIKGGLRQRAAEIGTEQLGYRTEKDVEEARVREIVQERYTNLDREIRARQRADDSIALHERWVTKKDIEKNNAIHRRLEHLQKLGLARKGTKEWFVLPNFDAALRSMQTSRDRLKCLHSHKNFVSNMQSPMVSTTLKAPGERVAGKLVATGSHEHNGQSYLVIEAFDGKIHFIDQTPAMMQARGERKLVVGRYVTLEVAMGKSGHVKIHARGYGKLSNDLIDSEILKNGTLPAGKGPLGTVYGDYLKTLKARFEQLEKANLLDTTAQRVTLKNQSEYERFRYREKGYPAEAFAGPLVGTVVEKGKDSILVRTESNRVVMLSTQELTTMGTKAAFMKKGKMVFVAQQRDGSHKLLTLTPDKIRAEIKAQKNILDIIGKQVKDIPKTSALGQLLAERQRSRQRSIGP